MIISCIVYSGRSFIGFKCLLLKESHESWDKNHKLVSQMYKTVTLQIVTFVPQIRLSHILRTILPSGPLILELRAWSPASQLRRLGNGNMEMETHSIRNN